MLEGCEIQKLLPRRGRRKPKAFVWQWPTPVPLGARTVMPPVPGRPVYGPVAKAEARRLLREAKRARLNLGPWTKAALLRVIRGEKPLAYTRWQRTLEYIAHAPRQRTAVVSTPTPAPWRVNLGLGGVKLLRGDAAPEGLHQFEHEPTPLEPARHWTEREE